MNILEKLKHHNLLIEEISDNIDNLIGEDFEGLFDMFGKLIPHEPLPMRIVKGIVSTGDEYLAQKELDLVDQFGNKIANLEKDVALTPDEIGDIDVDTDISDKIDWDNPELKREMERFKQNQKWLQQQTDKGAAVTTGPSIISNIKINFRGRDVLTVKVGKGSEMEQYIGGNMEFEVLSMKETSEGYILNLYNKNKFRRDTSLLLYADGLGSKPQTNSAQLIAKNGRFIGSRKKISFSITSTS
jgi:hypothetical protein